MSTEADMMKFWNQGKTLEELKPMISSPAMWEIEWEGHLSRIFEKTSIPAYNDTGNKSKTVLEIGCGVGRLLKHLAPHFNKVIGLDISDAMLAESKKYLSGIKNTQTKKINEDLNFPAEDSSVDFIYSIMVFQHIPLRNIIDHYLKESFRVLKPGGEIRVQTHRGDPATKFSGYHGHYYPNIDDFKEGFIASGFDVTATQDRLGHPDWMWVSAKKPE